MARVSFSKETRGTREIFAELYEEFLPRVFRYIRYRVNSEEVTEDLTSVVFEKALTNFEKYSKEKATFSTWIFSIARNAVIDHYRTQARRPSLSLEKAEIEVPSNEPLPVETLEKMEEREKLRECISRLPAEEQEIIALKFGSGMNNRQIAKTMGLSESNVGTRLYRAVRKLRDSFRKAENG
jgi:RNA polymerase sigma-70 factor (ECF subfamily)